MQVTEACTNNSTIHENVGLLRTQTLVGKRMYVRATMYAEQCNITILHEKNPY